MISFRLDPKSGVPPYIQVANQVRHALRLGLLDRGDQLPTVKEVVTQLAINPNTVLKAYRELEREGLVEGRAGLGTFVLQRPHGPAPATLLSLRRSLDKWIRSAMGSGLAPRASTLFSVPASSMLRPWRRAPSSAPIATPPDGRANRESVG